MPHIHLQTTGNVSENVDIADILDKLVTVLSGIETINAPSVKAYHTLFAQWSMGDGAPQGFVHCEVSILQGRELTLRKQISDKMEAALRESFADSLSSDQAGLTVEVREMDKDTYKK